MTAVPFSPSTDISASKSWAGCRGDLDLTESSVCKAQRCNERILHLHARERGCFVREHTLDVAE